MAQSILAHVQVRIRLVVEGSPKFALTSVQILCRGPHTPPDTVKKVLAKTLGMWSRVVGHPVGYYEERRWAKLGSGKTAAGMTLAHATTELLRTSSHISAAPLALDGGGSSSFPTRCFARATFLVQRHLPKRTIEASDHTQHPTQSHSVLEQVYRTAAISKSPYRLLKYSTQQ
ncbi:hypothetical protein RvY_03468 [Ramazzottius varieornatus]|uniref:Uncharacterized protein n=1 Tax=Ramazzottius varieornatus TaxID=947166 RepID=A0A1D1URX3_RAMVA|nr:hypothetical protein RvY_03468 [Ramazzottius varieornatus]